VIPLTLREIASIVDGTLADATGDEHVTGTSFVDSRYAVPGGLFVAVVGEHVDGHDYATDAVSHGAAAALTTRQVGVPAVVVRDTVVALGLLARHVVAALPSMYVVGVTGSQGKTSTKDLLAQVCERSGDTVAPAESLNNEIGVPLTALRATGSTRFLIVEMSTRGHGHISYLTSITPLHAAIVLNVGVAHLGEFGSRDHIAAAKAELVQALPADGVAVLNADDPRVAAMAASTAAHVVTFGESPEADVRVTDVRLDDTGCVGFDVTVGDDRRHVQLSSIGEHQARNAAAVIALATSVGIALDVAVSALETARTRSKWRLEVTTSDNDVTVVNDAYNANPDSMRAALMTLAHIGRRRGPQTRTFAVLGEMRELGASSMREHEAIGRLAARLHISQVVAVGDAARQVHRGAAREDSWEGESLAVADAESAVDFLRGVVRAGDVVLVKASRAAELEKVALALLGDPDIGTATEAEA